MKKHQISKRKLYVIIISGPAASGKTTIATELWKILPNEPANICLDILKHFIFVAESKDHYLDLASKNALLLMRNFLRHGHSAIVDKAFGSYKYIIPFVREARRLKVKVHYIKLKASLEELLRRNRNRPHYIPEWRVEAIYRFHQEHAHPQGIEIDTEEKSIHEVVSFVQRLAIRR